MRLFPVLLCYAFFLALVAVRAAAADDFTTGRTLFQTGRYQEAARHLQAAFLTDPANPDINFTLGRALFELGDYEAALMAFERVLISDPKATRVKLEVARCHYHLGFREMARQYFREVQATNPPAPVWQNIERYLAAIREEEKRHLFTGALTVGISDDDNVFMSPPSELIDLAGLDFTLTGEGSKPVDDLIYHATLVLNHAYRFDNRQFSWKNAFTSYHALYESESSLDVSYYEVSSGPVWKNDTLLWSNLVHAKHIDVEHDRYLGAFGFGSAVTVPIASPMVLRLASRIEEKNNHSEPLRDATTAILHIEPILNLGPNRFSTGLAREWENADADLFSYDRIRWNLLYERLLPFDLSAFIAYSCESTDYDAADPLFLVSRSDTIQEMQVGVSKLLYENTERRTNLSTQFVYTYTDADSNISLYRYRKNVYTLSLTLGFF
ncbi:MAG: tetratricopeptide repeat protein [Thermodesulfobacteriota bacterium]